MAKKSSGRWDHLLREIPVVSTSQVSAPIAAPATMVSEPIAPPAMLGDHDSSPLIESASFSEDAQSSPQEVIFSVSEMNRAIKGQLEGEFASVWLQGEISNFKPHTSGHYYFSLKDDKAQISAVMFKGFNQKLQFRPESGLEVIVRGKITVYEPRGNYQIFCETMEPVGAGALQKAFEQLKNKLQKEGLFDSAHKQDIPAHPKRLGVVTSPTGAAIQDILNVLQRRSKRLEVTVIPVRVQGDGASSEVAKAIELANKLDLFDVLIVGRGGGSIEDLWAFNEERVARAIFASKIPIISAVGHEIDFTISDFVADLRAPTPSAAAEVVARSEQEIVDKIAFFEKTLKILIEQKLRNLGKAIVSQRQRLIDPRRRLQDQMQRLDEWTDRLHLVVRRHLERLRSRIQLQQKSIKDPRIILRQNQIRLESVRARLHRSVQDQNKQRQQRLHHLQGLLDSLSPLRVVDRGFAIVRQQGNLVPSIDKLKIAEVQVEMRGGSFRAVVEKIDTNSKEKS